jgi:hypothetical protein
VIRTLRLGVALYGLAGSGDQEEALGPVPVRLIGRWENDPRSHAGCVLPIAPQSIRPEGCVGETRTIEGARERIRGGGVVEHDLACVNAFGQPYTLALV